MKKRFNRNEKIEKTTFSTWDYIYDSIVGMYISRYGMGIMIILVLLAPSIGGINTYAKNEYAMCKLNNNQYAVIVDSDNMVLVEKVKEKAVEKEETKKKTNSIFITNLYNIKITDTSKSYKYTLEEVSTLSGYAKAIGTKEITLNSSIPNNFFK